MKTIKTDIKTRLQAADGPTLQPRAVQKVYHGVPGDLRRSPEFLEFLRQLERNVHDHVMAVHFTMEDGEDIVYAHAEVRRGNSTDMQSNAIGHFNASTKKFDLGDGSATRAESSAATVEPDDAAGIEAFRQWLQDNRDSLTIKTDEVDGVTTFVLMNDSGDYLGYYGYEAGGDYGLEPRGAEELQTLLEPKTEADLEDSSVDALLKYLDSYYPDDGEAGDANSAAGSEKGRQTAALDAVNMKPDQIEAIKAAQKWIANMPAAFDPGSDRFWERFNEFQMSLIPESVHDQLQNAGLDVINIQINGDDLVLECIPYGGSGGDDLVLVRVIPN